jgi:hypothetical protein
MRRSLFFGAVLALTDRVGSQWGVFDSNSICEVARLPSLPARRWDERYAPAAIGLMRKRA